MSAWSDYKMYAGDDEDGYPDCDEDIIGDVPDWAWDDHGRLMPVFQFMGTADEQGEEGPPDPEPPDEWEYDCDGYTIALDQAAQLERTF